MESEAKKRWFAENTTFVGLKLHNKNDADILQALNGKAKQTEVKRLIRIAMKSDEKQDENA